MATFLNGLFNEMRDLVREPIDDCWTLQRRIIRRMRLWCAANDFEMDPVVVDILLVVLTLVADQGVKAAKAGLEKHLDVPDEVRNQKQALLDALDELR